MCEQLEMRMRNLKTFSTTRFPNSFRAVFDTLIDDFKAVVKCLENDTRTDARKRADDAKGILRRILSKSFVALQICMRTLDMLLTCAKLWTHCHLKGMTV